MSWGKLILTASLVFLLGAIIYADQAQAGSLSAEDPEVEPVRQAELVMTTTQYIWWLIRWSDNQVLCEIIIDHEGLPTGTEIYYACGGSIHSLWLNTPPCNLSEHGGQVSSCPGLYLYLAATSPTEKTIIVDLPQPKVWIKLKGCTPTFPANRCEKIPSLLLMGEEPLPNETITKIHAIAFGISYTCEAATCEIPLQPTPLSGSTIEFWADSSYGDSSKHFTALVRVIDSGVSPIPTGSGWYVDVISTQWIGRSIASCAQTWQSFPPIGGPPSWLSTPEITELLATEQSFYYLAGRLIAQGVVDASDCPKGGLNPNGYATACGLIKAKPRVQEWQNQFDSEILRVAKDTGVPAQLLKNLFARESQFWPGISDAEHLGLGHLTENGVEAIFLWDPTFYEQFCPLVLDDRACEKGYLQLDETQQAILRGALVVKAKTDCPECPAGIDLTNAISSISLFAKTLLANCEQTAQIVYNATGEIPGVVSSYEDLWRFTIANYHAGPGCLSYALYSASDEGDPLDWEHVSTYLTPACQGVIPYVAEIAK